MEWEARVDERRRLAGQQGCWSSGDSGRQSSELEVEMQEIGRFKGQGRKTLEGWKWRCKGGSS